MREIKFRAWDTENKTMRIVTELSFHKDGCIDGLLKQKKNEDTIGRVYLGKRTAVDVGNLNHPEGWIDDYPLMQYTGVKEKNGKEIYEGDICKYFEFEDGEIGKVYFTGGMYILCGGILGAGDMGNLPIGKDNCPNIKIIGNKFENPELLEQKSK